MCDISHTHYYSQVQGSRIEDMFNSTAFNSQLDSVFNNPNSQISLDDFLGTMVYVDKLLQLLNMNLTGNTTRRGHATITWEEVSIINICLLISNMILLFTGVTSSMNFKPLSPCFCWVHVWMQGKLSSQFHSVSPVCNSSSNFLYCRSHEFMLSSPPTWVSLNHHFTWCLYKYLCLLFQTQYRLYVTRVH